uniref:hypothetical protein n=1 Tax=Paractinoplanes polyasparticus TaxID=2856853 RepID=UPI001C84B39C|nr:hypothetical protein [Actinoplanes polyasparticus]
MLVEVLLDSEINVHYGFLTLCSAQTEEDDDTLVDAWRGQVNGLVGAAVPEMLRIRTDTHTGQVDVRIELHDGEPELSNDWSEIVDVWFASWVDDLTLSAFEEFAGPVSLPPGSYQVRCAAVSEPTSGSSAEKILLQFWPAAGTDRIVRQTGQIAAAWHRDGRTAPWTAAELSARVEELRQNRDLDDEEPEDLPAGWPHHYLLSSLGWSGQEIGGIDPALAAHLTTAGPETLRRLACWAVEQALTMAEIRDRPEIDEALAAVRRGMDLPPDLVMSGGPLGELLYPQLESEDPEAVEQFRRAVVRRQAVKLLSQAAAPPDLERTCSILLAAGRLTGGSPDWIVAAVRQVFPHLIPAER